METFKSLRIKMDESKESIIRKMPNLTDEQKAEAIAFFNKYNNFEKEVDWNKWRTLTWEDLSKVIYKDRSTKAQIKKKIKNGLDGFVKGKDYDILVEGEWRGEPYVAYIPYTWEASRMIASSAVPPVKLKYNAELGKTEQVAAKWCTAYNKDDGYWYRHVADPDRSAFIYICGETIPTKKVALEINGSGEYENCDGMEYTHYVLKKEDGKIIHTDADYINYNIWDFNDNRDTIKSNELPDLRSYFAKALEMMDQRRGNLLHQRYEKSLDKNLEYYSEDNDHMPKREEVKKAVMNHFKPEAWIDAAMAVVGKGEVDERLIIEYSSSKAYSYLTNGIFDRQKVIDYRKEVGLEDINLSEIIADLYEDEGPEAVKPFFSEDGFRKAEEYAKEHFKSLGGVVFLMDRTLKANLIE